MLIIGIAVNQGSYATGFGRAAVGICRRVCYDDGSAKMWGDTNMANFAELETGNDSGIELMFTYDANKKLTGVIANVSCLSCAKEANYEFIVRCENRNNSLDCSNLKQIFEAKKSASPETD